MGARGEAGCAWAAVVVLPCVSYWRRSVEAACGSGERNRGFSENGGINKLTLAGCLFALSNLRLRRDWTQAQLAQMVGVSQESNGDYEHGKDIPSCITIIKLAQAFGVTADCLLGLSEREAPPSECGELFDTQEKELINNFRSLRPNAKQLVIGYVQGTKDSQTKYEKPRGLL